MMKIKTQEFENGQAVLHIEVEPSEMDKSLDETYRRLAKKVNIPGFRKGKAPRPILERFVGKEALQEEALEHLIPQLCDKAAQEQNLEVIAQPETEVLDLDPVVVFKATFPLRPKVEIGDYHTIRLAPEPVEVTEQDTNRVMEQIRDQHALWIPVERPLEYGDMATLDIEQKREEAAPTTYKGQQIPIIEGSKLPMPGFAENLVGMRKNEEKEFSLSFPEDYEVPRFAGEKFDFKVKVTEIKEKQLPELNDEFAKSVGQDIETLDVLRDKLTASLKAGAERSVRRDFEQKVIDAVVALAKVEFPPVMVEQEIDNLLRERDIMLRSQGGLENYLRNIKKTEEEMREELRPKATQRLTQSLVLGKVVEEEKIEVSDAEIDAEAEKMISEANEYNVETLRNLLNTPQGRRSVQESLMAQKVVQRLTEIAIGSLIEVEAKEEGAGEESGAPAETEQAGEQSPQEGGADGEVKGEQS
ncbi:MAG: trigger factor [Chloroflexi bacterium]|nr:trigger factor [Chloroflexota bacterium]